MNNKIFTFYDSNTLDNKEEYKKYCNAQIKRCLIKITKQRKDVYYNTVSNYIIKYSNKVHKNMICLGSRNNWEKTCFQKNLKNLKVFDLDICEKSKCDYTYDFQKLPEEFNNKWDIIFTNSLDHSISPLNTINYWLSFIKKDGLLIIGYEPDFDTKNNWGEFGPYDCSTLPDKWYTNLDKNKLTVIDTFICDAGENNNHTYSHVIFKKN